VFKMIKPVIISDGIEKCIKAIGQSLIEKANDVSRDTERVTSITIHAEIRNGEVVNFDIAKNYIAGLEGTPTNE